MSGRDVPDSRLSTPDHRYRNQQNQDFENHKPTPDNQNSTPKDNDLDQNEFKTLYTIFNYVKSDIKKKQRSFKIGVFTIFLVVMFIVMLKSVVDKVGVAFLKVAQDQGGIFDVTLTAGTDGVSVSGDIDLYNSDPFEYQQNITEPERALLDVLGENLIKDNGDHLEILGFKLLNFDQLKD